MERLKIDQGGWVVVCDGRKVIILVNMGDRMYPNLRTAESSEHADAPTHNLGTDVPGRVHSAAGSARSAVEQTDWHDQAERAFLHGVAKRLDRAVHEDETKELVIVAAPRALGMLREALSDRVRKIVREEVAKDLVRLPIYEMEKRLFG